MLPDEFFSSLFYILTFLIFTGEMVELSKEGVKSVYIAPRPNKAPTAFCIFEYVYFARTDSTFEGTIIVFNLTNNYLNEYILLLEV